MRLGSVKSPLSLFLLVCFCPAPGKAHSYVFSREYEEMRDQVYVYFTPPTIAVQYESRYYGQIAPHVRNMIDVNADTVIQPHELRAFLAMFREELVAELPKHPVFLDEQAVPMRLVDIEFPGILLDSLLAPLRVRMVFEVQIPVKGGGSHELAVPPATLFLSGTKLIEMARERVQFTPEQEKAIGRFVLLSAFGDDAVRFEEVYPGFLRREGKLARIYGVFYDKSVLSLDPSIAPRLLIRFRIAAVSR